MILALATALMVAIHVAGAYLGLRDSPISREAGVPISLFEAAYWTAMYPYAPLLATVFAPMHVAGAAASWAGLQRRAYGVYEVELAALLYLLYLTLRPLF